MPSSFTSINRTLFIGDLSYFCREEHIHNLFSQYGPVDCLSIKRGKSTGDCLMHGFIQMSSVQAAEDALKALNGQVFMGRRMRVTRGTEKEDTSYRDYFIQLHCSFVSRQLKKTVTEEVLFDAFLQFGDLIDVVVKRHSVSIDPPSQCGYGFIYFTAVPSALKALSVMKHFNVKGVIYDCSVSHKCAPLLTYHLQQQQQQTGALPQNNNHHDPRGSGMYGNNNHHMNNNNMQMHDNHSYNNNAYPSNMNNGNPYHSSRYHNTNNDDQSISMTTITSSASMDTPFQNSSSTLPFNSSPKPFSMNSYANPTNNNSYHHTNNHNNNTTMYNHNNHTLSMTSLSSSSHDEHGNFSNPHLFANYSNPHHDHYHLDHEIPSSSSPSSYFSSSLSQQPQQRHLENLSIGSTTSHSYSHPSHTTHTTPMHAMTEQNNPFYSTLASFDGTLQEYEVPHVLSERKDSHADELSMIDEAKSNTNSIFEDGDDHSQPQDHQQRLLSNVLNMKSTAFSTANSSTSSNLANNVMNQNTTQVTCTTTATTSSRCNSNANSVADENENCRWSVSTLSTTASPAPGSSAGSESYVLGQTAKAVGPSTKGANVDVTSLLLASSPTNSKEDEKNNFLTDQFMAQFNHSLDFHSSTNNTQLTMNNGMMMQLPTISNPIPIFGSTSNSNSGKYNNLHGDNLHNSITSYTNHDIPVISNNMNDFSVFPPPPPPPPTMNTNQSFQSSTASLSSFSGSPPPSPFSHSSAKSTTSMNSGNFHYQNMNANTNSMMQGNNQPRHAGSFNNNQYGNNNYMQHNNNFSNSGSGGGWNGSNDGGYNFNSKPALNSRAVPPFQNFSDASTAPGPMNNVNSISAVGNNEPLPPYLLPSFSNNVQPRPTSFNNQGNRSNGNSHFTNNRNYQQASNSSRNYPNQPQGNNSPGNNNNFNGNNNNNQQVNGHHHHQHHHYSMSNFHS